MVPIRSPCPNYYTNQRPCHKDHTCQVLSKLDQHILRLLFNLDFISTDMVNGSGCYYEKKESGGFYYVTNYEYCLTGCCGSKVASEVKSCCRCICGNHYWYHHMRQASLFSYPQYNNKANNSDFTVNLENVLET